MMLGLDRSSARTIALLLALLIAIGACGPAAEPEGEDQGHGTPQATVGHNGGGSAPSTSVNGIPLDPEARFGGHLITSTQTEGPTFSTWEEAAGISAPVGNAVTNQILQMQSWGSVEEYERGDHYIPRSDLAQSWEQSSDGLQWTFRFYPGVTFSDGEPFTCEDAKWSLDSIRTGTGLRRSPRAVHLKGIESITCPDDLTMVINMDRPRPSLPTMIAIPRNVVYPAHKYANDTDKLRDEPPIGTGPFVLKEWVPGEKYVFEKRQDYWNKPFPYLDGMEVQILSRTSEFAAIRSGRIHLGQYGYTGAQAELLLGECADCTVFPPLVDSAFRPVHVNHERPPWNTPEIKDAISLAIDRTKVVNVAWEGWGEEPRSGVYNPGGPFAMPYERFKEIPGYNMEDPEGNKRRARELLAQAGYQPGELEMKLNFWVVTGQPLVPVLVEDLESVGFKVTPEILESARNYDILSSGGFDVHVHPVSTWTADPDTTLYEHYYTGSDRNYGRYSRPDVDRLIDEMSATLDFEERRQKAWQIGEILMRDQAKIILGYTVNQPIFRKEIRGLMPGTWNNSLHGPWMRHEHLWLAE
jgi:ABC-type transport system substrate-binding protein